MKKLVPALIAASALALTTPALSASHAGGDARLQTLLAGRVAGKPVDCISLRDADATEIVDGKAIVYRVGSRLYVNEPQGAGRLDRNDILVSHTFGTRLCSIDTVRLYDCTSRFPTGFVTLGRFVPYTKVAPPA